MPAVRPSIVASPALLGVVTFAILLETAVLHVIVHTHHPWLAWTLTVSSLSLIPWIWSRLKRRTH
jgi:hypothetical protein